MFLGIAGLLLAVIGLAALLYPIYLDQYDVYGIKITCGNSLRSNLGQAAQADGHDAVRHCGTALLVRRAWAISAVTIGWLLVTGFLAIWVDHDKSTDKSTVQAGQL
jgi:hypothetical protein